jgi:hypothetical protein
MNFRRTAATGVALVVSAIIGGAAITNSHSNQDMTAVGDHYQFEQSRVRFTIEGKPVTGLYPGKTKQMKIVLVNPAAGALQIREIGGRVTKTSRRGCNANDANILVLRYAGRLPIFLPPRSTTQLDGAIPITMPGSATPRCAKTTFTIALHGAGTRVVR